MKNNLKEMGKIYGILGGICILCVLLPPMIGIPMFLIAPFIFVFIVQKKEDKKLKEKLSKKFDISEIQEGVFEKESHQDFYNLYDPKIKDKEQIVVEKIKIKNKNFSTSTFKQKGIAYIKKIQNLKKHSSLMHTINEIDSNLINELKNVSIIAAFIIDYKEKKDYEYIGIRLTAKEKLKQSNDKPSFNNYYMELKKDKNQKSFDKNQIVDIECHLCGAPIDIANNTECPYCGNVTLIDEWQFNKLIYWKGEL